MSDAVEPLILDLLDWLRAGERPYAEVMEAWRTSCPRLPVWEEANDRGLIAQQRMAGQVIVRLSPEGRALLERRNEKRGNGARPA